MSWLRHPMARSMIRKSFPHMCGKLFRIMIVGTSRDTGGASTPARSGGSLPAAACLALL
jgi:hypothetical protein